MEELDHVTEIAITIAEDPTIRNAIINIVRDIVPALKRPEGPDIASYKKRVTARKKINAKWLEWDLIGRVAFNASHQAYLVEMNHVSETLRNQMTYLTETGIIRLAKNQAVQVTDGKYHYLLEAESRRYPFQTNTFNFYKRPA